MDSLIGHLPGAQTDPQPPIQVYPADPNARTGVGLIIFPGGGYGMLAEHEGQGYAEYFAAHGITSFVVTYRLGSAGFRHPAMIEDALAAIHTVRHEAGQWGINPTKIGVIGSSAGGHLAAHSLVAQNCYDSTVSLQPNFGILCYPVIAVRGPHSHLGSRANLLGSDPTEAQIDEVDLLQQISAQTPPTFLWHTVEDAAVPVENSLLFASALRAHGVPFELHIYERGRHGLGLGAEFTWAADALRWIGERIGEDADSTDAADSRG